MAILSRRFHSIFSIAILRNMLLFSRIDVLKATYSCASVFMLILLYVRLVIRIICVCFVEWRMEILRQNICSNRFVRSENGKIETVRAKIDCNKNSFIGIGWRAARNAY